MQNNNKVRTNGLNGAQYRGLEPSELSEIRRSVVDDREKTSLRRERGMMAQRQMATSGGSISASSPPSSSGPLKFRETEGEFENRPSLSATVHRTFGTSDADLSAELLLQVTRALPRAPLDPHGNYALAALYGISPSDTLEGMLAAQMVAEHNLAMEFFRRAALKDQTPVGVELNVNLATKLQRTFLAQVEALDRRRGRGEQDMKVEHVDIHDGAQGIVGPVRHQGSSDASAEENGKSN